MLRHIVLVKFAKDVPSSSADAVAAGFVGLRGEISEIVASEVHRDAGILPGNHQLVLVADFADEEAVRRYLAHPAHQKLFTDVLSPVARSIAVAQYEIAD